MASVQLGLMSVLRSARSADYDPSHLSLKVAIWFNYAGIYLAIGTTLSAMYVLQWAAELTTKACSSAKVDLHSTPAQRLQGKLLPGDYLNKSLNPLHHVVRKVSGTSHNAPLSSHREAVYLVVVGRVWSVGLPSLTSVPQWSVLLPTVHG